MKGFIEVHRPSNSNAGFDTQLLNINQIISIGTNGRTTIIEIESLLFHVEESYEELKQKIEEATK